MQNQYVSSSPDWLRGRQGKWGKCPREEEEEMGEVLQWCCRG